MNKENKTLRLLSALGIIFILSGHIGLDFFTIGGLFPYYSFHVYIFIFIAGYFYNPQDEEHILKHILKKAKNLLIPYFVCNLIYGIVVTLLNTRGFYFGQDISLYNLFLAPFFGGHQFMLNAPSWFLVALFLTESIYALIRLILKKLHLSNELLLMGLLLLLGVFTVFLAIGGHVWGHYKDIGRLLIMLPGIQFGRIYKEKIEARIKNRVIHNLITIVLCVGVALLLKLFCGGLAFSTVWVSGFANGPIIPFITVIIGIGFWYSISDLIVFLMEKNEIADIILDSILNVGRHTMSIMLHHLSVFLTVNCIFYSFSIKEKGFTSFDSELLHSDIYYVFGTDSFKWGYLMLGIVIPTLLGVLYGFIKNKISVKYLAKKASKATPILVFALCSGVLISLCGCGKSEAKPYVAKDYVAQSTMLENETAEPTNNPNSFLSVPTYVTKIKDRYFIVDCYHNAVIYADSLDTPLYEWKVMCDINMGHTIASDGLVYMVDDTENNRMIVLEEDTLPSGEIVYKETQEFTQIGNRPHYVIYDEPTDTFYAWSSLTGQMYCFRHESGNSRMYLTKVMSIPELDGFYVRSFTIIDDKVYFVSGNLNVIEAKLENLEVIKRYPVTDEIAGMVQLTKIQDYYYITVSTDALANQDAATLIRCKSLEDLATGNYEDVYDNFIGGGTPYAITNIDGVYYLCEHRLPGHSIWSFKVEDNEIKEPVTIY